MKIVFLYSLNGPETAALMYPAANKWDALFLYQNQIYTMKKNRLLLLLGMSLFSVHTSFAQPTIKLVNNTGCNYGHRINASDASNPNCSFFTSGPIVIGPYNTIGPFDASGFGWSAGIGPAVTTCVWDQVRLTTQVGTNLCVIPAPIVGDYICASGTFQLYLHRSHSMPLYRHEIYCYMDKRWR